MPWPQADGQVRAVWLDLLFAQNNLSCPCLWKYYNSWCWMWVLLVPHTFPGSPSILPTFTLAATPITLSYFHSLWHLFDSFFFFLSLYHVVTWILSFSGYLDRALLWSPDWLQTQNNSPASFFWVLGFQPYTTYSGPDSSLNSLFRSRWITWEKKLFHLFLPIVQSILSNEHISIGHVARYLT